MRRSLKTFLPLLCFLLTGCGNFFYFSKLGWHQSFITFQSVPVQEVIGDETLEDEGKRKIHIIQEVKRYGEERLGLRRTGSYTKYFEVKRPVLHIITATEKDRLHLHHWNFPIIGRATYKSFFTLKGVLKEKESLEKKGYDTYLQQAAAYSTLGWLKDPIFSTMLKWDEPTLANIILHEMAHATVYFKGETDFNEQVATFIGNQGAVHFLTEKYGPGSKEVALAIDYQGDDLLFSKWIDQAYKRLSGLYEQPVSREEKVRGREEIFQSIQESFVEIRDQFKTDCYKDFGGKRLNNAVLMAYRRYFHRLDRFEALYERFGKDLKRVVEFFKEIKSSGDERALTSFKE
ncbi:MAG: aminopeptidase [Deltaproteobacteria bacterium]|nr:aminopeptidase [Deltaproteobacteria bacterium]